MLLISKHFKILNSYKVLPPAGGEDLGGACVLVRYFYRLTYYC
jgi:hypothetical protein